VQALRRHWQNAFIALLVAVISLCFYALSMQSHQIAATMAILRMQTKQIEKLKKDNADLRNGLLNNTSAPPKAPPSAFEKERRDK
jgi:hypothetical protein